MPVDLVMAEESFFGIRGKSHAPFPWKKVRVAE
jgi:hypothetical protein